MNDRQADTPCKLERVLAENLVGQLLKWSGSPARSVLVYVQNLPDLFSYQALQDRLRQDMVLVEKVQGIRYHPDLSRLDLVLTEQNWQQESVAEQIEYLAASIEAAGRYQVLAKGQRSLSIRCLR